MEENKQKKGNALWIIIILILSFGVGFLGYKFGEKLFLKQNNSNNLPEEKEHNNDNKSEQEIVQELLDELKDIINDGETLEPLPSPQFLLSNNFGYLQSGDNVLDKEGGLIYTCFHSDKVNNLKKVDKLIGTNYYLTNEDQYADFQKFVNSTLNKDESGYLLYGVGDGYTATNVKFIYTSELAKVGNEYQIQFQISSIDTESIGPLHGSIIVEYKDSGLYFKSFKIN